MYFSPTGLRVFSSLISAVALLEICIRIYNYKIYFLPDSISFFLYNHQNNPPLTLHDGNFVSLFCILFTQIAILIYTLYLLVIKRKHPRLLLFLSGALYVSLNGLHIPALHGGDAVIYTSLIAASLFSPYTKLSYYTATLSAASLYLSSALHKHLSIWVPDGTAVYYVLNNQVYATSFGKLLSHFPFICTVLTYFTIIVLYFGWIGLLIPYKKYAVRKTSVILLAILHFGLTLTMHIHLIGIIMLAFVSLFWVYKDQTEGKDVPPVSSFLTIGQFFIIYLICAQLLYNFGFFRNEYTSQYSFLKIMNFHVGYFGYKVGYNFFSHNVREEEWFNVYEPSTMRDVLRGGILDKQLKIPLSYGENVVNARLHRILYTQTRTFDSTVRLADYFCSYHSMADIVIEKSWMTILPPQHVFFSKQNHSEPIQKLLLRKKCN